MARKRSRAAEKARAVARGDDQKNPKQQPRRRAPSAPPRHLGYSADEVNETLFPVGKRVKLSTGEVVEIRPWPIRMYGEIAQRAPNVMERALGGPDEEPAIGALFEAFTDEVVYVVSRTIGWSEEEIHAQMSMDDLLAVTLEVWDTCVAAPAAKIVGLLGRVTGMVGSPAALNKILTRPGSSSRSSSSSRAGTPGQESGS